MSTALRRIVIVLLVIVVALLIALAALWLTREPSSTDAEPTATVTTEPAPEPIARDTSTPLLAALPDQVLGYAVTGQSDLLDGDWVEDPLEQWELTYSSASDDVSVRVAQWLTPELAQAAMQQAPGTADSETIGDVIVDGAVVGSAIQVVFPDGSELLMWRNNTAVFQVVGPSGTTLPFYNAYPL
ncbi:MAG: hypothetical protein ACK5KU_00995 [Beutenbergiaceae bacterium]